MKWKQRKARGSTLIESVVAALILVPIALCLFDLTIVVVANSMNDSAAKNAARAAANQPDGNSAFTAATNSLNSFSASSLIVKSISIQMFDYPADQNAVTCQTKMVVHLPVPFPGLSDITFMAQDVEPIVASK
jgi:Tfp pilus assembly protein PilV